MDVHQLKTFLFVNLIIALDRSVIVGICFPSGIHKAPGLPQPCQSSQHKHLNSISDLHFFTILWVSTWNSDLFYPLFVSARLPGCVPENCSALTLYSSCHIGLIHQWWVCLPSSTKYLKSVSLLEN